MAEYIEREALIERLKFKRDNDTSYPKLKYNGLESAIAQVMKFPAADVVEVVRMPVVGYEGYYEVDQFGRVFSVDRVISVDDNGRKYDKPLSGKQMKQSMHDKGYKIASLTRGGKTKMRFVHRLVAEAFIPNPDNLPLVNHKDEDGTNNWVGNLEWCDRSYNATYGSSPKKKSKAFKGRESEKRKAVLCFDMDRVLIEKYSSVTEAAKAVNGTTANISAACKGKKKTAYGKVWAYDCPNCGARMDGDEA